jgi:hypothetical protein
MMGVGKSQDGQVLSSRGDSKELAAVNLSSMTSACKNNKHESVSEASAPLGLFCPFRISVILIPGAQVWLQ